MSPEQQLIAVLALSLVLCVLIIAWLVRRRGCRVRVVGRFLVDVNLANKEQPCSD